MEFPNRETVERVRRERPAGTQMKEEDWLGQDILSKIYYGKIVPWEQPRCRTPEMEGLRERISSGTACLEGLLDEKGKELLEQLLEDDAELMGEMSCESFKDGFRFGVQVMLAAMGTKIP